MTSAVACGGVVYRLREGVVELALCGRRTGLWALPKGTPDAGETLEQTALREVQEETGLEVEIEAPLGHIEYWFTLPGERVPKRVYFYLMAPLGRPVDHPEPAPAGLEGFRPAGGPAPATSPTRAAPMGGGLAQHVRVRGNPARSIFPLRLAGESVEMKRWPVSVSPRKDG